MSQRLGRTPGNAPAMAIWTTHDDQRQEILAEIFTAFQWDKLGDLARSNAYTMVDNLIYLRASVALTNCVCS